VPVHPHPHFLLFHSNNGFVNAPQCYVIRTFSVLLLIARRGSRHDGRACSVPEGSIEVTSVTSFTHRIYANASCLILETVVLRHTNWCYKQQPHESERDCHVTITEVNQATFK
jgi:hypothetical protein